MEDIKHIQQDAMAFEQNRQEFIKSHPERREVFKNDIGHPIKALYTPLDLEERGFSYEKDCGFPGQFPYVRGDTPNMVRSEHTIASVYSGFGTAEDSRDRYEKIVKWGGDKLNMAWDLPSQIGYDSDDMMATGEIGRTGIAVDSLKDLEILFQDIPLNSVKAISTLANSIGPIGLALLIALGEKQGLTPDQYRVILQNDPLKEYAARGTYIFPIEPAVRFACDAVEWCINNAPNWKPIQFCANHFNAAGAGSTNAAAFAMSDGFTYIDELVRRGYEPSQIVPLARLFLDDREDFFVAAALGRAGRKVWAQQMMKRYGCTKDDKALCIDFTSYGHGGETLQEPINNILRIGFAALGYYLGGCTYQSNAGYDEAMGLAREQTCKVSIRTSQIINNEFGFSKTIDPLAGSYYVESLTMDIERDITAQIEHIQKEYGSSQKAIEAGYYQGIISRGAVRRQTELEEGERRFVGVNIFPTDEDLPRGAFRLDKTVEQRQLARLKELRETRDNRRVKECLDRVREDTINGVNVVPSLVEALKEYATIGEICNIWREIYGEYRSMTTF